MSQEQANSSISYTQALSLEIAMLVSVAMYHLEIRTSHGKVFWLRYFLKQSTTIFLIRIQITLLVLKREFFLFVDLMLFA